MYHAIPELKGVHTVFGEEIVGAADDELRYDTTEFLEFLLALCFDSIGGVRITTTDDGILKVLAEVILGTEEIGVCKVQKREVFREIVLHDTVRHSHDDHSNKDHIPE